MSAGVNAGAAGAAAAAAIAQATKASGVIVRVDPVDFLLMVDQNDEPLVVHAQARFFFRTVHQYLTSYRGLAFFTKSGDEIPLPEHCQLVEAKKIWVPG